MIFSAALLLAATLTEAPPVVQHWRLLVGEERVAAFDGEAAPSASVTAGATGAWAWREGEPPRRVAALGPTPRLPPAGELESFEVRVRWPKAPAPIEGAVELVAAPVAMWEEVPEPLLPRVSAGPAAARIEVVRERRVPYRVRLLAGHWGSAWADVPADRMSAELPLDAALERKLRVLGGDGAELGFAQLHVFAAGSGSPVARFAAEPGPLQMAALPNARGLAWVVSAPGHLPRRLDLPAAALPSVLRLEPSFGVRGRLVDAAGRPIPEADIAGAAPLASAGALEVVRETRSDAAGHFELTGLPAGSVRLAARKRDFGSLAATVELPARQEGLDLGTIVMPRGASLRVRVRDARGEAISGASVHARPEIDAPARTDDTGLALLAGATPGSSIELEIRAEGYLPERYRGRVEVEREVAVVLREAFLLQGRFLDSDGVPVEGATARIASGSQVRTVPVGARGELEIELPPGQGGRMTLASPRTAELAVDFEPGEAGEVRDLGDLVAPSSRRLIGALVDALSAKPVAGARIRAPRPDARHPMESWFFGRWLESGSDAEGRFELAGLADLPVRLRIEAPGYAALVLELGPAGEEDVTDLGTIPLAAGASVLVRVPDLDPEIPEASVEVRLDPGRRWQEYEMSRAPLVAGEATFFDVAPGPALVTAVAGREVLCEADLVVEAGLEEPQEVECRPESLEVAGLVRVGGEPSGSGTLVWLSDAASGPGFIVESAGPLGGVRSEIFGGGRPQVDVVVSPDGRFLSRRLRPGGWNVLWIAEERGASRPVAVEIPDLEGRFEVVLDFASGELEGRVVDRDGFPLEGATVTEKGSGATTVSRQDGHFRLLGLEPGALLVQAEKAGERSSATRVVLDPAGTPPPIELVVPSEDEQESVRVAVEGADGGALSGALIFVQSTRGETRVLTSGADGRATLELEEPVPEAVRFALLQPGAGLLGGWLDWERIAGTEVVLRPAPTAHLLVRSDRERSAFELGGPGGWDVGDLLRRLGLPLVIEPGAPLALASLPEGDYLLRTPGRDRILTLVAGENAEVSLEEGVGP